MRPVFADSFVEGLSLAQVIPAVSGNAAPQDMMMAAFNNADRVDLEIAKMFDRRAGRVGTVAERIRLGARPRRHERDFRADPTLVRIRVELCGPHSVGRKSPSSTSPIAIKITAS